MKAFLTEVRAREAISLVLPAITAMMNLKVAKREALHIIVLAPEDTRDRSDFMKPSVLATWTIGEPHTWKKPYHEFAMAKATMAWRNRMSTREMVTLHPYLLMPGDIKYPGGVVEHGIAVGVSGVESHWDEMFAHWVAAACVAVCHREATESIKEDEPYV